MNVKMTIQQTSLWAYGEVKINLGERQKQIYLKLKEMRQATNTMLSHALSLPINCVTPRIKELRDKKMVGVFKVDRCPITQKNVIWWRIVG